MQKFNVNTDPIFKDQLISKFIKKLSKKGNTRAASKQFYQALTLLNKDKYSLEGKTPIEAFYQSVNFIKPVIYLKAVHSKGKLVKSPTPTPLNKQLNLAILIITDAVNKRSENCLHERIANELNDILSNSGISVKKKNEIYKLAIASRTFI